MKQIESLQQLPENIQDTSQIVMVEREKKKINEQNTSKITQEVIETQIQLPLASKKWKIILIVSLFFIIIAAVSIPAILLSRRNQNSQEENPINPIDPSPGPNPQPAPYLILSRKFEENRVFNLFGDIEATIQEVKIIMKYQFNLVATKVEEAQIEFYGSVDLKTKSVIRGDNISNLHLVNESILTNILRYGQFTSNFTSDPDFQIPIQPNDTLKMFQMKELPIFRTLVSIDGTIISMDFHQNLPKSDITAVYSFLRMYFPILKGELYQSTSSHRRLLEEGNFTRGDNFFYEQVNGTTVLLKTSNNQLGTSPESNEQSSQATMFDENGNLLQTQTSSTSNFNSPPAKSDANFTDPEERANRNFNFNFSVIQAATLKVNDQFIANESGLTVIKQLFQQFQNNASLLMMNEAQFKLFIEYVSDNQTEVSLNESDTNTTRLLQGSIVLSQYEKKEVLASIPIFSFRLSGGYVGGMRIMQYPNEQEDPDTVAHVYCYIFIQMSSLFTSKLHLLDKQSPLPALSMRYTADTIQYYLFMSKLQVRKILLPAFPLANNILQDFDDIQTLLEQLFESYESYRLHLIDFLKTLNYEYIIGNISSIDTYIRGKIPQKLGTVKTYYEDLLTQMVAFTNTQIFGQFRSALAQIFEMKNKLIQDDQGYGIKINEFYQTAKTGIQSLVSAEASAQLSRLRDGLQTYIQFADYVYIKSTEISQRISIDERGMIYSIRNKIRNILVIAVELVQFNMTTLEKDYETLVKDINQVFNNIPNSAERIFHDILVSSKEFVGSQFYQKIIVLIQAYPGKTNSFKDLFNQIQFPESSVCHPNNSNHNGRFTTLKTKSAPQLITLRQILLKISLISDYEVSEIITLIQSTSDPIEMYRKFFQLGDYDNRFDRFSESLAQRLNNIFYQISQYRVWKDEKGYKYHELQKYLYPYQILASQIIQNELEYNLKAKQLKDFEDNCLSFLVEAENSEEIKIFYEYWSFLKQIADNYLLMMQKFENLKNGYDVLIQNYILYTANTPLQVANSKRQAVQIQAKVVRDQVPSQLQNLFTVFSNRINQNLLFFSQSNYSCSAQNFPQSYRLFSLPVAERVRASQQAFNFWKADVVPLADELIQLISSINESMLNKYDQMDTKFTNLLKKQYTVEINSTLTVTFIWETVGIIDANTFYQYNNRRLFQCPEASLRIYEFIMLHSSFRYNMNFCTNTIFKLHKKWKQFLAKVRFLYDPLTQKKQSLKNSVSEIVNEALTILSKIRQQKLRQIKQKQQVSDIILKQFMDLKAGQLVEKKELTADFKNKIIEILVINNQTRTDFLPILAPLKGLIQNKIQTLPSLITDELSQQIITQVITLLQKLVTKSSLYEIFPNHPLGIYCYDRIKEKGQVTIDDPLFLGYVTKCGEDYFKTMYKSYAISAINFKNFSQIFVDLNQSLTEQIVIINETYHKIKNQVYYYQPFKKEELQNNINIIINATYSCEKIYKNAEVSYSKFKFLMYSFQILYPQMMDRVDVEITQFFNRSYFSLSYYNESSLLKPSTRLFPQLEKYYKKLSFQQLENFQEMFFALTFQKKALTWLYYSNMNFRSNIFNYRNLYDANTHRMGFYYADTDKIYHSLSQVGDLIRNFTIIISDAPSFISGTDTGLERGSEFLDNNPFGEFGVPEANRIHKETIRFIQEYLANQTPIKKEIFTALLGNTSRILTILQTTRTCSLESEIRSLHIALRGKFQPIATAILKDIHTTLLSLAINVLKNLDSVQVVPSLLSSLRSRCEAKINDFAEQWTYIIDDMKNEIDQGYCQPIKSHPSYSLLNEWSSKAKISLLSLFTTQISATILKLRISYNYLERYSMTELRQWFENISELLTSTPNFIENYTQSWIKLFYFISDYFKIITLRSNNIKEDLANAITNKGKFSELFNNVFSNGLFRIFNKINQSGVYSQVSQIKGDWQKIRSIHQKLLFQVNAVLSNMDKLETFFKQLGSNPIITNITSLQTALVFIYSKPIREPVPQFEVFRYTLDEHEKVIAQKSKVFMTPIGPISVGVKIQVKLQIQFFINVINSRDVELGIDFSATFQATGDLAYGIDKIIQAGIFIRGIFFKGVLTPKFILVRMLPLAYYPQIFHVRKYMPPEQVIVLLIINLKMDFVIFEFGAFFQFGYPSGISIKTSCFLVVLCLPLPSIQFRTKRFETALKSQPLASYQGRIFGARLFSFNLYQYLSS